MYIFFMRIFMKKLIFIFSSLFLIFSLTGCPLLDKLYELFPFMKNEESAETPSQPEIVTEPEETEYIAEIEEPEILLEIEPEDIESIIVTEIDEPEIIIENLPEPLETVVVLEVEKPEIEEPEVDEEEYLRSIDNLDETESVSKLDFTQDKNAILHAISDLSQIMESKDVDKWLEYIEPSSIEYYSNQINLRKAQKKLPNKTIVLRNISDYFYNVFIPSRQRSQVDEIRYISKNTIKAVQVKEDKSIVVYYYFTKIGNKWLVQLPVI